MVTVQGQILTEYSVVRCAIHPRFLKNDGPFDPIQLLDFRRARPAFDFKSSVGNRGDLTTETAVHAYGCRSAAISNDNKVAKNEQVVPLKNAAHYVGFYEIQTTHVAEATNDIYIAFVERWPELGEDAHCHLVLRERDDLSKDLSKHKADRRTDAITAIWHRMTGPSRHICDCDLAVEAELSAVDLPILGLRSDATSAERFVQDAESARAAGES
jgi:hypothetical protein